MSIIKNYLGEAIIKNKGYHPSIIGRIQTPSERKKQYVRYMLLQAPPYKGRMLVNRSYTVQEKQDRVLREMYSEGIVTRERVCTGRVHRDTWLVLNYDHTYVQSVMKQYNIKE